MIDWFVVLVPLALLPILLLFVFVGCVLDREGQLPGGKVRFNYSAGLDSPSGDNPGLDSIQWHYNLDLESDLEFGEGQIGNPPGGITTETFERGGDSGTGIKSAGEVVDYLIYTDTYGPIKCYCTVVTAPNPPFDETTNTINLGPVTKQKIEDEDGPEFRLQRDGAGFSLT